jgi:hypothetical protein
MLLRDREVAKSFALTRWVGAIFLSFSAKKE